MPREHKIGRPCKAEIRWYGATDDGLYDARLDVKLWGMEVKIEHWNKLPVRRLLANKNFSDTNTSDLVLSEDWPSKLKKRDRPVNKKYVIRTPLNNWGNYWYLEYSIGY